MKYARVICLKIACRYIDDTIFEISLDERSKNKPVSTKISTRFSRFSKVNRQKKNDDFSISTYLLNETYSKAKNGKEGEECCFSSPSRRSMTSRYATKLLLCAPAFGTVADNRTEFNLTATWLPECDVRRHRIFDRSQTTADGPRKRGGIENAGILRRKVRHILRR